MDEFKELVKGSGISYSFEDDDGIGILTAKANEICIDNPQGFCEFVEKTDGVFDFFIDTNDKIVVGIACYKGGEDND